MLSKSAYALLATLALVHPVAADDQLQAASLSATGALKEAASPLLSADTLNFRNYGNWGSPTFAAQFDAGTYAGHLTDPVKMPMRGMATYNGALAGYVYHGVVPSSVAGAANLDVNFSARSLQSTFSGLTERLNGIGTPTPLAINGIATPTIAMMAPIAGNSFASWNSGFSGEAAQPVSTQYQALNGKFYGPNAAAVAGSLYTYNTRLVPQTTTYQTTTLTGTFSAAKH